MEEEDNEQRYPDKTIERQRRSTNISGIESMHSLLQSGFSMTSRMHRKLLQPHFTSLSQVLPPRGYRSSPCEGICAHYTQKGFTTPRQDLYCALWTTKWLYIGAEDGNFYLWDANTMKVSRMVGTPHVGTPMTSMVGNPQGGSIVTGDREGRIVIFEETIRHSSINRKAHQAQVRGLSFSPFDSKFVSCSDDKSVKVWDTGRLDEGRGCISSMSAHNSNVHSVQWHPHRGLIASGSWDKTVKLWDPRTGGTGGGGGGGGNVYTISSHLNHVNAVSWSCCGNRLASASKDSTIKIFDIRNLSKELEVLKGHGTEVTTLAFHPQIPSLLVSGGGPVLGALAYWVLGSESTPHTIVPSTHMKGVKVLSWNPAGNCLLSIGGDTYLKFWTREPPGSTLIPKTHTNPDPTALLTLAPSLHTLSSTPLVPSLVSRPFTSPSLSSPVPSLSPPQNQALIQAHQLRTSLPPTHGPLPIPDKTTKGLPEVVFDHIEVRGGFKNYMGGDRFGREGGGGGGGGGGDADDERRGGDGRGGVGPGGRKGRGGRGDGRGGDGRGRGRGRETRVDIYGPGGATPTSKRSRNDMA